MYQIRISENLRRKLQHLAGLARRLPSGDEAQVTAEFDRVYGDLMQEIPGDDHYHLRAELEHALYRFVKEDPWAMTKSDRFRIHCQHEPSRFADFIEELLDPSKLERRYRLCASAGSLGLNATGLFNDEIKAGNSRLMEADMAWFHEQEDDRRTREMLGEVPDEMRPDDWC